MFKIKRFYPRSGTLAPWVKHIWVFESERAVLNKKLLPTECVDVILNLASGMVYKTEAESITAPPVHVNGLRSGHSRVYHEGLIRVIGISFYPFGLYPFIRAPLTETRDSVVGLSGLSAPLAEKFLRIIDACKSVNGITGLIPAIEGALYSELDAERVCFKKESLMNEFIYSAEAETVKSFCARKGVEIKTFERMSVLRAGYTPQILRRVKRFQNAAVRLIKDGHEDFASLAYDGGFSDQSHFIKEFKRFSGASPGVFKREKDTVKENFEYSYQK